MSASKRSNASRYSNSRAQAGKDAARNVGVVLGLGGLSFFLGFFVLARMVPDRQNEGGQPSAHEPQKVSPASNSQVAQTSALPAPSDTPTETIPVTAPPTAKKKSGASDVTIEPGDEAASQKPGSLDETPDKTNTATGTGEASSNDATGATGKKPDGSAATVPVGTEGGSLETPASTSNLRSRTHKTRGHSADNEAASASTTDNAENGGISEGDQKPSKIDRDPSDTASHTALRADRSARHAAAGSANDSTDEETPKAAKPVRRARYRVVAGAYTLRTAAERAAQKVTDLGLEATVVPVTKDDGTTVYRVQQGVYRLRANANAAKQKLADAGLDADVVKMGSSSP